MNTSASVAARATRSASSRSSASSASPTERWTIVAGAVYVAAWICGLLVVPSAPASTGPAVPLHDFYLTHAPGIVVQALLVYGLAGIALVALAAASPVAARVSGRPAIAVRASGWAAASVSFVQVGLTLVATLGVSAAAPATTRGLVHAVDLADAVKLVLLAAFVTAATALAARAGLAPRWLRVVAAGLVVLLPLGGASFVVANGLLGALLVASLPMLLLWAGALAYLVGGRAPADPLLH